MNEDVEAILGELYETAYQKGYWSGQRRWTEGTREEAIQTALAKLKGAQGSPTEGAWQPWIDHEDIRESGRDD